MVTRRTSLPGSRGPFLGPDGKHLEQYQDAERASRSIIKGGPVFDIARECAFAVGPVNVATSSDDTKFIPLRISSQEWELVAVSMSLQAGTAPTAECAIYAYEPVGYLRMVPNSLGRIPFESLVARRVDLLHSCYLEPGVQYFFASRYSAALGCTFTTGQVTSGQAANAVMYKSSYPSLPAEVRLQNLTKLEAPYTVTADRRFIMATYYTSEGVRIL